MSQAHWDEGSLHLAIDPCNGAMNGVRTSLNIRRLPADGEWILTSGDQTASSYVAVGGETRIELQADGSSFTLTAADETVTA